MKTTELNAILYAGKTWVDKDGLIAWLLRATDLTTDQKVVVDNIVRQLVEMEPVKYAATS